MTRGFITIATGKEMYFQSAKNLLLSYKLYCDDPLPFAIMCDQENEYTALFDDVVLLWYGYQSDFTLDDKKATSYCKYTIDGRCGLMDVKGAILTEPIYTDIVAIEKELFLAKLLDGSSQVLIDGKGEVINR